MQYTIVGAGAIGGTIGAHLARAGQDVLFVDGVQEHVNAINRNGITSKGYAETFTVKARAITPEHLPDGLQCVILAVKSPATQSAIRMIAPHLAPDGFVMSAQNGLNEHWIAEVIGRERTIGCFINFSATYLEPGVCALGGPGAFWIGELDGATTPRLATLHKDLSAWNVAGDERRQVRTTENIWGYLWGKMGYGAMLFATALSNETMADGIHAYRATLVALAREIVQVARAEGVHPLGFDGYDPDAIMSDDEARTRESVDALVRVRQRDAQTHSGVWRDLAVRKRATEVDAQFTPILERAEKHNIEMPLLRSMVRMMHEIENGARPLARANLDELAETHLLGSVSRDNLWETNSVIASWVRLSGSPPEREAFDFCQKLLEQYGLKTELVSHPALISYPLEASVDVLDAHGILIKRLKCLGTACSTSAQALGAEAVDVGWGTPEDYARADVRGRIVLINGLATPGAVQQAERAGAIGQIFINDEHLHNMIVSPVWGTPTPETAHMLPRTPSVSVLGADGEALRTRIAQGGAQVRITSRIFMEWQNTPILIGEIFPPGADATEHDFVLFSGHLDSWEYGAMDNGSANATMLEVARILAKHAALLKRGLRLCFWSGHSHGRYSGSTWYADAHWEELHDRCIAHVNVDSTGARGATSYSHQLAHTELSQFGAARVQALAAQTPAMKRMSRAGDMSFNGIGIPSLFMTLSQVPIAPDDTSCVNKSFSNLLGSGMPWWWHTDGDTMDKVDLDVLNLDTRVYVSALWRLCTDAVLPMRFEPVAVDILTELYELAGAVGQHFDFAPLRTRAAQLCACAATLDARSDALANADKPDAGEHNATLVALSRVLIPATYTVAGAFDHDPALGSRHLPQLQCARALASLDGASNDYQFMRTRVQRNANALAFAVRQAIALCG